MYVSIYTNAEAYEVPRSIYLLHWYKSTNTDAALLCATLRAASQIFEAMGEFISKESFYKWALPCMKVLSLLALPVQKYKY
jgi:hypothetical protein